MPTKLILAIAFILFSLSSCQSLYTGYYIDRQIVLDEAKGKFNGSGKMPMKIYIESHISTRTLDYYEASGRARQRTTSSPYKVMKIFILDTVKVQYVKIDDREGIYNLLKDDPNAQVYLNKYKSNERIRKINKYASYAAMGLGLALFSSGSNTTQPGTEPPAFRTSDLLLLGGFLNWTVGGNHRLNVKRQLPMKAVYSYYYGKFPRFLFISLKS